VTNDECEDLLNLLCTTLKQRTAQLTP